VTEDGRIQSLEITFSFALDTCTITAEDVLISNRAFELVLIPELLVITGTFETDTTWSGSYKAAVCEFPVEAGKEMRGWFPPLEATLTASWERP